MHAPPFYLRRALGFTRSLARAAFKAATGVDVSDRAHLDDLAREAEQLQASAELMQLRKRADQLELLLTEQPFARRVKAPGAALQSPVVSVSMATRNRAHCIGDAIRSLQAQTFSDWELVVIDDGSTDETREIVAGFAADRRIRYAWQPHSGLAAARNHSLRLARGAFIAYLDDDNLFYPNFLGAAVGALVADKGIDCLYGALVSDVHRADGRILFESFDRERLLKGNFIDMGVLVHRRELIERFGGIDETIECLCDWDFVLRVTAEKPAHRLPVLSTRYRVKDDRTLTATRPFGVDYLKVRRKWFAPPRCARLPRVLYLLGDEADSDRAQVEMRCMRAWGIEVDAWWPPDRGRHLEPAMRFRSGNLGETIARTRPDVIHAASLDIALREREPLIQTELPVTATCGRTPELTQPFKVPDWVERIYCAPEQRAILGDSPKLRGTTAVFDTSLFGPAQAKHRREVLAACATVADDDLLLIHSLATKCSHHRFVILTRAPAGECAEEVKERWRRAGAPGDLLIDPAREVLVGSYERAGIYLQLPDPRQPSPEPSGSIAQAMATGAYILVPSVDALIAYAGDAGRAYADADAAAALIMDTRQWSAEQWRDASRRAVNRAFCNFADELVLRPMFDDWCALSERNGQTR